ncbi:hypothetical protein ABTY59_20140 [Streptomyces sp. NPDC096079]|uniref:hypothetical protein n=1 Tax=Streptomyces sp. NPDC096079 TaxID=3155820 RepID=UPI003330BE79
MTNKQIAERQFLSHRTVGAHLHHQIHPGRPAAAGLLRRGAPWPRRADSGGTTAERWVPSRAARLAPTGVSGPGNGQLPRPGSREGCPWFRSLYPSSTRSSSPRGAAASARCSMHTACVTTLTGDDDPWKPLVTG